MEKDRERERGNRSGGNGCTERVLWYFEKKTRIEVIKRKMIISEAVEEIQRRQFIWYGHVRRMEENSIPRMAM